ncbi:MAG: glycosyltransferase [Akkermansia sp.]|nr:glycosyltransferase [Akkermansia sp.]
MQAPKISVIVPVFNRENTIATCIAGICNTDFESYEIIIVDDGSTDNSLQNCQKLAEKNSRIHVFSQQNAGVSAARNLGIQKATGEYLTFVDSDDTLCPNALKIITAYTAIGVDMLMYPHVETLAEKVPEIHVPDISEIDSSKIIGNQQLINWIYTVYITKHSYFSVIDKVFNTRILRNKNIRFHTDVSLGEDQIFVCEYLKCVQSLVAIHHPLSYILLWEHHLRPYGLGLKLRSPEDFLHNQLQNYRALMGLYQHCGLECVHQYARDYILDRPVSRILIRHLCFNNKIRASISELISFTENKIKPVLDAEKTGISAQKNKHIRRILQLITSGHTRLAITYAFFFSNLKFVYAKIKKIFRYK